MNSFPNLELVCCSMSSSNCCFLTCIQISQEAGQMVWYSHLFKNVPQFIVIHTVKGFGIVYKAEVDVFLELFCFFDDPKDVGNLISGPSAFSKFIFCTWKFSFHVLLKPSLENFEHFITIMWNECNYGVVWTFCGIALLWYWNENLPMVIFPLAIYFTHDRIYTCFDSGEANTVIASSAIPGINYIEINCHCLWGMFFPLSPVHFL